jgi:hypothetical protein
MAVQVVSGFFLIAFLAAALGVIKPYTSHLNRWQFAVIAILSGLACGATASNNSQLGLNEVFALVFCAFALGAIKPYTERISRWQFAVASIISMVMIGATADPTKFKAPEADAEKIADADRKATKAPIAPKPEAVAKSDDSPFADVGKQQLWIVRSHDAIKARLRDPGSADFRNSRFYSGGTAPVVCGEVNSKNGFGGYSGFQRFIAAGDVPDFAFLASDFAAGDSIDNVWKQVCVRADRDEAYVP